MNNITLARFNMIEQQIRPWDVLDQRVLDLIHTTPREAFVPQRFQGLAFADTEIPLGHGETMLAPKMVGRMLQALNIDSSDTILEIGTGSGYVTALLAHAGRQVYSIDIHPDFTQHAAMLLHAQGIHNVALETGDAAHGWPLHQPYDVILITGSLPILPPSFQQSLQRGGRLVAVVGDTPVMEAILITRTGDNEWSRESLFETSIKPLANAPQPSRFTF